MRFVKRPIEPPEALSAPEFARMRRDYLEFLGLDPDRRRQTRPPDLHLPKSPLLKTALDRLFLGKCAFCEQGISTRPYRFRPTANASSDDKVSTDDALHYGWLADSWQNLQVICIGCLPRRQNVFPILGTRQPMPSFAAYAGYARRNTGRWYGTDGQTDPDFEMPLLMDPCRDQPSDHFGATTSGDLVPRSLKGDTTLRHFKQTGDLLRNNVVCLNARGRKPHS